MIWAPPARHGTGRSVLGSSRNGRSASPSSQTSPLSPTLAPAVSIE